MQEIHTLRTSHPRAIYAILTIIGQSIIPHCHSSNVKYKLVSGKVDATVRENEKGL